MRAIVDDPIPHPSEIVPIAPRARRDRDARAAQAEGRALRERARDGGRAGEVRLLARRLQPDAGRDATRSRCSRPSTCSGARRRPRRSISRSRSRPRDRPRRSRASARSRRPPARRWRCGPASRGRTAAASCAARPAAAAAAAARVRAQAQPRSQPAHGRPAARRDASASHATGAGVVDQARSHLAVRGRRRAAGRSIGGGAWMLTRQQEITGAGVARASRPRQRSPRPSIDELATAAAPPAPRAVTPAVAPAPKPPPDAPACAPDPNRPPAPTPAADVASWNARRAREQSRSPLAHAVTRVPAPRPTAADGDDDEKPRRLGGPQNADPFAD